MLGDFLIDVGSMLAAFFCGAAVGKERIAAAVVWGWNKITSKTPPSAP